MKERPILFSAPMVRAILAGAKTQTRRVVSGDIGFLGSKGERENPDCWGWAFDGKQGHGYAVLGRGHTWRQNHDLQSIPSPYGDEGDQLWVRESLVEGEKGWTYAADGAGVELANDDPRVPAMVSWAHHKEGSRCNSIHMPRFASRITLEVTSVRVERLQAITEDDARAEGVPPMLGIPEPVDPEYRDGFRQLWDGINGKRPGCSWADNPWVWAVSFRRIKP